MTDHPLTFLTCNAHHPWSLQQTQDHTKSNKMLPFHLTYLLCHKSILLTLLSLSFLIKLYKKWPQICFGVKGLVCVNVWCHHSDVTREHVSRGDGKEDYSSESEAMVYSRDWNLNYFPIFPFEQNPYFSWTGSWTGSIPPKITVNTYLFYLVFRKCFNMWNQHSASSK